MSTYCSPIRDDKSPWTCYSLAELVTIVKSWNSIAPMDKKIDMDCIENLESIQRDWNTLQVLVKTWNDTHSSTLQITKFPIDLIKNVWLILQDTFQPICSIKTGIKGEQDICWMDKLNSEIHKKNPELFYVMKKFVFKPRGTKEQFGWLSTTNIEDVMKQYEVLYPNFKFLDCVPSDHYKLNPHEKPWKKIKENEKSAIVFNLDKTSGPGTHWVAIFFQHTSQGLQVEYFDSTAHKPSGFIKNFIDEVIHHFKATLVYNKFHHQKKDTECGVYSLFYIQKRLQGATFEDFQKKRLSDELMNAYRPQLFRPFVV
jgi:hypothetical protein